MDIAKQTIDICKLYGIDPKRSKGQNFLISEKIYDKIVKIADISENDVVLEVGPGLGFLTSKLAKKARKVIAVELDDKLAGFLKDAINNQNVDNVEVINQNILDFNVDVLPKNFKIVANLPYNITSVFLRKFLSENKIKPSLMVLMLQKEVAQRITAQPGDMSLLACSVQLYADAEIALDVPSRVFWPEPKVDSAVVRLQISDFRFQTAKNKDENFEKDFFRLLKFAFAAKRKMLRNNLAAGFRISSTEADALITRAGLKGSLRAEDLSMDDWIRLYYESLKS